MARRWRGSGGADEQMLRVDASRFGRRRRRGLLIWLTLGSLVLGGVLLGVLAPHAATTIEIWGGPGTALIGW
jgi:hypothetical protein